jgi:hypothetical protein
MLLELLAAQPASAVSDVNRIAAVICFTPGMGVMVNSRDRKTPGRGVTMRNRSIAASVRAAHERFWMLPPIIVGLAAVITGVATGHLVLPPPPADMESVLSWQVDQEDAALCAKFGFAPGTRQYAACKLDLLDLRHHDEALQYGTD